MDLALPRPPAGFTSNAQIARKVTEPWAAENLFCPNCPSPVLAVLRPNTKAKDFRCPECEEWFQLKSAQSRLGRKIPDAGYDAMIEAIASDETPNLFALNYNVGSWSVENVILIPRFAYSISAIEKRPPLKPTARRAGWVGCNILLTAIPDTAKIPIISAGKAASRKAVRESFARLRPLAELGVAERGWTLDVYRVVQRLGKRKFVLADVNAFAPELGRLHPGNRHVREKIRQQLQVLRDRGLVRFLRPGEYEISDE